MGKLEGKIALVTGSTSGMGLATAKRFVDDGAFVFVTGRCNRESGAKATAVPQLDRSVIGPLPLAERRWPVTAGVRLFGRGQSCKRRVIASVSQLRASAK
jgi:NAD(P)-dependent dehydrogenase (short-subunit alcohol dehydrogenase family)